MNREQIIERMARAIYDTLEGPINTQDAMRQMRQWHSAQQLATAALTVLREAIPGLADVISGKAVVIAINALREAERQARSACLMPPDGGSPTDGEADVADRAGNIIRTLADRAMIEARPK